MSVTVQTLYTDACNALLEPPSLSLYLTTQDFLDWFRVVLLDFVEQAGLVKQVFTQQIVSGTSQYTVPDDVIKPTEAFVSGKLLEPTSLQELDDSVFAWQAKSGPPQLWRQDSMAPKTLAVFPKPTVTGTSYGAPTPPQVIAGDYNAFEPANHNLSIVGITGTLKSSFALGDNILILPDSFTFYLTYGVLAKIFSQDGEAKDDQRAAYCQARYLEGISLGRAMVGQLV